MSEIDIINWIYRSSLYLLGHLSEVIDSGDCDQGISSDGNSSKFIYNIIDDEDHPIDLNWDIIKLILDNLDEELSWTFHSEKIHLDGTPGCCASYCDRRVVTIYKVNTSNLSSLNSSSSGLIYDDFY